MPFFRADFSQYLVWLVSAISLSLVTLMSTNAAPNMENTSKSTPSTPSIPDTAIIDKVFVDKSARVLQLLSGDTVIKSYHIALGGNPIGHKQQQGDKRTPSGSYTLDYKNEKSKFYRSIHISYPNAADKAHAKKMDIMIHGQKNGSGHLASVNQLRDWTEGCIAVTDEEMDEIMAMVKVGTAIEIVE